MMCRWRFSNRNKSTTPVDFASEGGCPYVGVRNIWEISVPSAQFFCKPTTALKKSIKKYQGQFMKYTEPLICSKNPGRHSRGKGRKGVINAKGNR